MIEFNLPQQVTEALLRLNNNGYSAYAVGGSVRDMLMKRQVNDYDICTSATPEQISSVFQDFRTIETGIAHGTVTVKLNGLDLEITTFRHESKYSDCRHPDSVSFTKDLIPDLARRDFTINAIAYSPSAGIIDPFNGIYDIRNGIIKCVGEPMERFNEDALRILRALRFASVLNFDIERNTSDAVLALVSNLDLISRERIREEFCKLLCGSAAPQVLLQYNRVIEQIIPEISVCIGYDQNNPHHEFDLYTHSVYTLTHLPPEPVLRFCGLMHDIGKPITMTVDDEGISHYYSHAEKSSEIALTVAERLRFSSKECEKIKTLIRLHDGVIDETPKAVKRRLNQLGNKDFFDLLSLQRADNAAQTSNEALRLEHNRALRKIAENIIKDGECITVKDLALNGYDIAAHGYRGKQIGKALSLLLDAVISEKVKNENKALHLYLDTVKNEISALMP